MVRIWPDARQLQATWATLDWLKLRTLLLLQRVRVQFPAPCDDFLRYQACTWYTYIHEGKIFIHVKVFKSILSLKKNPSSKSDFEQNHFE